MRRSAGIPPTILAILRAEPALVKAARSHNKARGVTEKKSEETVLGKATGFLKRLVLGQDPMTEGAEKETAHENLETEETAEATFEAVRNSRKSDQITVR